MTRKEKITEMISKACERGFAIDCLIVSSWDVDDALVLYDTMPTDAVHEAARRLAIDEMLEDHQPRC